MSGSLARQAVSVAVVAVVIDVALFAASGVFAAAQGRAMVVAIGLVVADVALASPTGMAGAVAVAHVVVRLVAAWLLAPWLLHRAGTGGLHFDNVGILVAGYRAGAWLTQAHSLVTVSLLATGTALFHWTAHGLITANPVQLVAASLAVGVVPWLVGRYTTARRGYLAELEQRLQRQRAAERAAMEQAITAEREAIARDLHDVISHHVSAIGIHAGAARLALTGTENSTVFGSLAAVESGSRAAMADLRRHLDLLHGSTSDGHCQPGLANIDELLERARAAGMQINIDTIGVLRTLPHSVDVALYRIAQEILTNALRHGDGKHATLRVEYTSTEVLIHATNPLGSGPSAMAATGHGLAGIRQRAELFGGAVEHGAQLDDGLWAITVRLAVGNP